eukprot:CAMPEP_0113962710 /NCGR_PEP_ID=MMETSP0011_2-20120614/6079_1 /TAXON_ID=101924 /ORGANISM="Rhodosorus marinus" /LENGTH=825 /DNA_ID=CAMNT_0000974619 /DNA_START=360 /DNA_END=2838 /DNA_ORIENTATION=- /assembly_acc=CAM_ASM_000156
MIGEDGEVCVDLSTTPYTRRRHPDLPEVLGSACVSLNEDRDGLNVQFKILDGVGDDLVFKRTQGGAYAWMGQIPRASFRAHRTSTSHTDNVKETTMSLDLTIVHRECCAKGILLTLRAIVYPKSDPGSRIILHPAEDAGEMCTRNDQSRVRTCIIPVSCEEDSCPVPDTGAPTCVRTSCPDTTSTVGPIDCDIVDQAVGSACSLYGDPGTWQVGTRGNLCVCELNATPEPCIINGNQGGIFPGDLCRIATLDPYARAIRTSANGECSCPAPPDAARCSYASNDQLSGAECVSRNSGAPGVIVNLGEDNFISFPRCECAVPCEYATNPVSNPSAIALGHVGQECSPELAGSDVRPPGVLVESSLGTCTCQPLARATQITCEIPEQTDSSGQPQVGPSLPYGSCNFVGNARGVSIPTDADSTVCDCVPKEACQCPPGERCEYTGMFPGDSCATEFGIGLLAQRSDGLGCSCRINCTLSPCESNDPEDCQDYTFGTCDLNGEEGIVVPTSEAGTCTCARCDPGTCGHPDLGCIVEGKSCMDLSGRTDVFFADEGTKCNCGCELSIPNRDERSATLGGECSQGLATGVIVDGNVEGKCGCQVQNCTSSSCLGPVCETFDGVIGETCESDTGVVTILSDGSCKCQQICQTIYCGDGTETCSVFSSSGAAAVGVGCFNSMGVGILEASSEVDGECDCVSTSCSYSNVADDERVIGFGNPGDGCIISGAPGVLSDVDSNGSCTCEPLCDVPCVPKVVLRKVTSVVAPEINQHHLSMDDASQVRKQLGPTNLFQDPTNSVSALHRASILTTDHEDGGGRWRKNPAPPKVQTLR